MNLGEWLNTWLELYVEPSGLAENTKKCYTRAVAAVPDALATRPLEELTALDVRRWLLDVAKRTPRAAQLDRVMLSRSLRIAAKLGLCRFGIIDPDTCPQIIHKPAPVQILDRDQLRAYMAAACASDDPDAPALCFCALGMRRGEARGVTWADIDLDAATVAVTGQRQQMGPKLPCKTQASYRVIGLPSCVVTALLRRPRGLPWVFVAAGSEQRLYRLHGSFLSVCGLPRVTLHALRHSVATTLVADGQAMKAVQGHLGHAHYQITADIYAHHLPTASHICERLFV